ncbi:hypothetical protein [Segatella baroniae]|uniref:hypothetical protein n=1 Tax=Segatella baroniae TaxID=305719 RepID=UPI0012B581A8|nr:hypothetical protein [Segatella baroniae]
MNCGSSLFFLLPFFNQFKREVSGAHRAVLESPRVGFKPTGLPFLRGRIAFGSPSLPFRLAKGLPLRAKRAAFTFPKGCFHKLKGPLLRRKSCAFRKQKNSLTGSFIWSCHAFRLTLQH